VFAPKLWRVEIVGYLYFHRWSGFSTTLHRTKSAKAMLSGPVNATAAAAAAAAATTAAATALLLPV